MRSLPSPTLALPLRIRCAAVLFSAALALVPAAASRASEDTRALSPTSADALAPARGRWVAVSAPAPTARVGAASCYDARRNRTVFYGGRDWRDAPLGDLWALDHATSSWIRITAGGTPPPARGFATLIYDPLRDRALLFGGKADDAQAYNDVWALSFSPLPRWKKIEIAGLLPSPRDLHGAVYDSDFDRMLIMGGSTGLPYMDVWELPCATLDAWHELPITSGIAPGAGYPESMFDPLTHRVLFLHGTSTYYFPVASDSVRWGILSIQGTPLPSRESDAEVLDTTRHRILICGGDEYAYPNKWSRSDVWALPLGDSLPQWSQLVPDDRGPRGRRYAVAAYDAGHDRLLVAFGEDNKTPVATLGDVWALDLATNEWSQPTVPSTPPVRANGPMFYDAARDRFLVFGGDTSAGPSNDLWQLTLRPTRAWMRLAPTGDIPSRRAGCTFTLDAAGDRGLLYGGGGPDGAIYALSLSSLVWSSISASHLVVPGDLTGHGAVWDSGRNQLIVYGGAKNDGDFSDATLAATISDSVSWRSLGAIPGNPFRVSSACAYDARRNRVVAFGGIQDDQDVASNTLSMDLTVPDPVWAIAIPNSAKPGPRYGMAYGYDEAGDRLWIFGGIGELEYTADVWALDLGAMAWRLLPASLPPMARVGAASAFDPLAHALVLHAGDYGLAVWVTEGGGHTEYRPAYLNDTWLLPVPPTAAGTREYLRPTTTSTPTGAALATAPDARWHPADGTVTIRSLGDDTLSQPVVLDARGRQIAMRAARTADGALVLQPARPLTRGVYLVVRDGIRARTAFKFVVTR